MSVSDTDPGTQNAASDHPKLEFIGLMAMLAAMVAFAVDSMLPALPDIGAELTPEAPNRAQLIVTSFVLGLGIGTFFVGALSDRYGRKPVILAGGLIYVAGSLLAWAAPSLETILAARVLQGLGAAAPRIVSIAIIRDLYGGRQMARVLSIVLLVFTIFPALAPSLGAGIIAIGGWRAIFAAFVLFAAICLTWLALRQDETLAPEHRRPISLRALTAATAEMFAHPTVRLSIYVQTLAFGILFSTLSSMQPIFDLTYGEGAHFHLWIAGVSLVAASASVINAWLVPKLGMRALIKAVLIGQVGMSSVYAMVILAPLPQTAEFAMFVLWITSVFFTAGMTLGNLNALALEPLGHIAGLAASLLAALATVGAVVIAVPLGLLFDGTALPLVAGVAACALLGWTITRRIRREGIDPE